MMSGRQAAAQLSNTSCCIVGNSLKALLVQFQLAGVLPLRRNPRQYFHIFDNVEVQQPDGRFARFELVSCKCVDTYVRVKQNQNQICWKWRKVGLRCWDSNLFCIL